MEKDPMIEKQQSMLEGIVADIVVELYQKWFNQMPEEQQKDEQAIAVLGGNASEATYFVVQRFMEKFNAAAEQIKQEEEQSKDNA
jgi:copper oxidase (laccase) domain-containing protein